MTREQRIEFLITAEAVLKSLAGETAALNTEAVNRGAASNHRREELRLLSVADGVWATWHNLKTENQ